MTENLPAPLVPRDVDLSDFGYMPLDVRRLRDSKIAAATKGDEFRAAVLLWCAAWHQLPAASIPNDDVEMALLAGYGRVIKEWRKVKAGALHGWILCSDGRFYHPVVAEKAIDAWNEKRDHAWSRECDRIRKENKRREQLKEPPLEIPKRPERISMAAPSGFPLERDKLSDGKAAEVQKTSLSGPAENSLKGEGKGKDIPPKSPDASDGKHRPDEPEDFLFAFEAIREDCFGGPAPTAKDGNPKSGRYSAKDISVAKGWIEDGIPFYPLRNLLEKQMSAMANRNATPPSTIWFFHKSIEDAAASNWAGYEE